ncbi:uncharacterized protein Triagg1_8211 [Trichoderma aggressivum f. europaeum]|uniref:Uncharacterized protein n=1 Tax=Trichoderma aggressivum f. europaeum TaxID=173218 RepID=A0AAE1LY24_9HYPO|nr:hypothetical protein Triagg1_8211 [Trichoderma aggressivum f. europaeum]
MGKWMANSLPQAATVSPSGAWGNGYTRASPQLLHSYEMNLKGPGDITLQHIQFSTQSSRRHEHSTISQLLLVVLVSDSLAMAMISSISL